MRTVGSQKQEKGWGVVFGGHCCRTCWNHSAVSREPKRCSLLAVSAHTGIGSWTGEWLQSQQVEWEGWGWARARAGLKVGRGAILGDMLDEGFQVDEQSGNVGARRGRDDTRRHTQPPGVEDLVADSVDVGHVGDVEGYGRLAVEL